MPSSWPRAVCVTGAGGFIGSWLVKELLRRGYCVRGVVRNPEDGKNAHLRELDGAKERLSLCRADVLDYQSLLAAFRLCDGVFHVACPLMNDDPKLLPTAIEGTKNVVNAAAEMGVWRVVYTSSYGALHLNPNRSPDQILDESCWNDLDSADKQRTCTATRRHVEKTATEEASRKGIQLLVVVPAFTIGEMLQPTLNGSVYVVARYLNLKGTKKAHRNMVTGYVDVQDVARAHVLVYEDRASHGRYLCIANVVHQSDVFQTLNELFPQYPIPTKCDDEEGPNVKTYKFSTQRLQALGMKIHSCERKFLQDGDKPTEEWTYTGTPTSGLLYKCEEKTIKGSK